MKKTNDKKNTSFSCAFPRIKNFKRRKEKAGKVKFLLENYTNIDFQNSICLDIGCSTGVMTVELANIFRSIIGIEYDFDALLLGIYNNSYSDRNIHFINADGMYLPIKNETIDVIICSQVYEHVKDDLILADEMYRVLKSNGVILFSGPNKAFPFEFHYKLPFIHWFPKKMGNFIINKFFNGNRLYERIRLKKDLLRVFNNYYIQDLSIEVVQYYSRNKKLLNTFIRIFPKHLLNIFTYWVPNFNWLIRKNNCDRSSQ